MFIYSINRLAKKVFRFFGFKTNRTDYSLDHLDPLDPKFRNALISMYKGEQQLGIDGKLHQLDGTRIAPREGMWLYNLCLSQKPESILEIGLAYGFSTLYILAAIEKNRVGHHTAIDPLQSSHWHGIGLTHAKLLSPVNTADISFRFIEDFSVNTATDLRRSNSSFDLIFIDGGHRFDDVLVDFCLYSHLCAMNGLIILDDKWLSSIKTVAAFIRKNRDDFVELKVDLPNVFVFKKTGVDSRSWQHFRSFHVSSSTYDDD